MIIAHFSKRISLTYALGFLGACALMYTVTLYHPPATTLTDYLNSKGLFRYEFAVIAWICGALLIVRQLTILRQIIAHKSNAVWTAHGNLYYLNIYLDITYRAVPIAEIVEFQVRSGFAPSAGISVRLRSGQERVISTWLLLEPVDLVISRLWATQCVQTTGSDVAPPFDFG
jgi:hypothetical protein